jgi:hypothetical protein
MSSTVSATPDETVRPETEVPEKAIRRRFTSAYKVEILRRAEGCHRPGELGALLRKEGLYTSHLSQWRRARENAAAKGLESVRRGRKPRLADERDVKIADLEKKLSRANARLVKADLMLELQKKVSEILGIALPSIESDS